MTKAERKKRAEGIREHYRNELLKTFEVEFSHSNDVKEAVAVCDRMARLWIKQKPQQAELVRQGGRRFVNDLEKRIAK